MELTSQQRKKIEQTADFLKNPNTAIYKAILDVADKLEEEKPDEHKEYLEQILEKLNEPQEVKDYTAMFDEINEKLNEEQNIIVTLNVI